MTTTLTVGSFCNAGACQGCRMWQLRWQWRWQLSCHIIGGRPRQIQHRGRTQRGWRWESVRQLAGLAELPPTRPSRFLGKWRRCCVTVVSDEYSGSSKTPSGSGPGETIVSVSRNAPGAGASWWRGAQGSHGTFQRLRRMCQVFCHTALSNSVRPHTQCAEVRTIGASTSEPEG